MKPGMQVFHLGRPVELLHRVSQEFDTGAETWLVRPLFIVHPENRTEVFRRGDRMTALHGRTGPWSFEVSR